VTAPANQPKVNPALAAALRHAQWREAIASVALTHPIGCACDVCRAAQGDDDAMVRVVEGLGNG
jgi:hypothetical protein